MSKGLLSYHNLEDVAFFIQDLVDSFAHGLQSLGRRAMVADSEPGLGSCTEGSDQADPGLDCILMDFFVHRSTRRLTWSFCVHNG